jgi:hypothetical protein
VTHRHSEEMAAAEAARRRAKEALEEVKAQRPEVKEVAKAAVRIRRVNGLADAVVVAMMGGGRSE